MKTEQRFSDYLYMHKNGYMHDMCEYNVVGGGGNYKSGLTLGGKVFKLVYRLPFLSQHTHTHTINFALALAHMRLEKTLR